MQYSIILPLYNKASYIKKTLLSIACQSYTNFEFIIINDGSTDDSMKVVKQTISESTELQQLKEKNNLIVLSQENKGVSIARNNGVKIAKGNYILFIDGDDWWDKDFLFEMDLLIQEYPDAGIYGTSYFKIYKHKRVEAQFNLPENFSKGYIDYCKLYADNETEWMPLTSISVAIKKEVFTRLGGFQKNISFGQDFLLWFTVYANYKIAFTNKTLAYYNQNVAINKRSVGRIHPPQMNMIWHFDQFMNLEKKNKDVKRVLDILRARQLYKYYITNDYKEIAEKELKKIDWENVPLRYKTPYKKNRIVAQIIYWLKNKAKCILRK